MLENLKNRFKDRFLVTWLSILILVLLAVGAKFALAGVKNPSIEDVLSRTPNNGFDFSMFVASLLALSLATISAAKGYEIVKRSVPLASSLMGQTDEENDAAQIQDEEIAELRETIAKLERCCRDFTGEKESLLRENTELKERLNKFSFDMGELSRAEQMLRKSNISLSRECERLIAALEEPRVRLVNVSNTRTRIKAKSPLRKRGKRIK